MRNSCGIFILLNILAGSGFSQVPGNPCSSGAANTAGSDMTYIYNPYLYPSGFFTDPAFTFSSGEGETYTDNTSLPPITLLTDKNTLYVRQTTTNTEFKGAYLEIYVDLNRNDHFEPGLGELVYRTTTPTTLNKPYIAAVFYLPQTTALGPTRLRFILREDLPATPNPCVIYAFGETEDFSAEILTHCKSSAYYPEGPDIGSVRLGDFSHGNKQPVFNNPSAINAYSDFTALSPIEAVQGEKYLLNITQINSGGGFIGTYISAFIYSAPGGVPGGNFISVYSSADTIAANTAELADSIVIPGTLPPGSYLFRIVMSRYGYRNSPCNSNEQDFGETEDYTIRILPAITLPACPVYILPADGATGVPRNPLLTWETEDLAITSFNVYVDTLPSANNLLEHIESGGIRSTKVPVLEPRKQYYWKIVPSNLAGSAQNCAVRTFITGDDIEFCQSHPVDPLDSDIGKIKIGDYVFGNSNPQVNNSQANKGYTDNSAMAPMIFSKWGQYPLEIWPIFSSPTAKPGRFAVHIFEPPSFGGIISYFEATGPPYPVRTTFQMPNITGRTRLRITFGEPVESHPFPCDTNALRGETEDYAIEIREDFETVPDCASYIEPAAQAQAVKLSTTLQWLPGAGAPTQYDVYFGTNPDPPYYATTVSAELPVKKLKPLTTYYWRIVPKNPLGEAASCSEIRSFTTGPLTYCEANYTDVPPCIPPGWYFNYIQETSTADAQKNLSNSQSFCIDHLNASDFTGLVIEEFRNDSFRLNLAGDQQNLAVKIWVDWNEDGDFGDVQELVFPGDLSREIFNAGHHASILIRIPPSVQSGLKRFRIRSEKAEFYDQLDACGPALKGETEDYSLQVLPLTISSCPAYISPLPNTVIPINQITLRWKRQPSATFYRIYLGQDSLSLPFFATTSDTFFQRENYFLPFKKYYWKIVPANSFSVLSSCPIWSFETSYCDVHFSSACKDLYIKSVQLNNGLTTPVEHSSGCSGDSSVADYSNISLPVQRHYPFAIRIDFSAPYSGACRAWVDWNENGLFESSERLRERILSNSFFKEFRDIIPFYIKPGRKRLRVQMSSSDIGCGLANGAGETEDYTIEVLAAEAPLNDVCTGAFSLLAPKCELCNPHAPQTTAGTNDEGEFFSPCANRNIKGSTIWFKFIATDTVHSIILNLQDYFGNNDPFGGFCEIFRGTCDSLHGIDSLVFIDCGPNGASPKAFSGLTVGEPYSIRVISNHSFASAPLHKVSICVTGEKNAPLKIVNGNSFICPGDSIELSARGKGDFLWRFAKGDFIWTPLQTGRTIKVSPKGSTIYSLTRVNDVCTDNMSAWVYVRELGEIIPRVDTVLLCAGSDTLLRVSNAQSAVWSDGQNAISNRVAPLQNTRYTVHAVTPGACAFTDSIYVKVLNLPAPGQVTNMLPADGQTDLNIPIQVSWGPAVAATHYDLYTWRSGEARPSQPVLTNWPATTATIHQNLDFGHTFQWQLSAKNMCHSTDGPIQAFTLRNLPDLVPEQINFPASAFSGEAITISWTVKNDGLGNSGLNTAWRDAVYLSDDSIFNPGVDISLGDGANFTALSTGQAYTSTYTFRLGPSLSGKFYVIVVANWQNNLLENTKTNNVLVSDGTLSIQLSNYSDLVVTNLAAPLNIFSGQPFSVSWQIKNAGLGQTDKANWADRVFLTTDTVNFSNRVELGGKRRLNLLEKDSFYNVTITTASLPVHFHGAFYLVMIADADDNIWEFVYENNNLKILPVTVLLAPPPDLVVTDVSLPDTIHYGLFFNFDFKMKNQGAGPTHVSSYSGLYLTTNPDTLSPDAIYFDNAGFGIIPQNEEHALSGLGSVSNYVNPGIYYGYVRADQPNSVFEFDKEGNNTAISRKRTVLIAPELEVGAVKIPPTVLSGQSIDIAWSLRNNSKGGIYNTSSSVRIYVSASNDPQLARQSGLVFNFYLPLSIQPEGLLNRQQSISLPCAMSADTYYVFVEEDVNNSIVEKENLNLSPPSNPCILSFAPCPRFDLAVTHLGGPDTLRHCVVAPVEWRVQNISGTTARIQCDEQVFLSKDLNLGPEDWLVARRGSYRQVEPGGTYQEKVPVSLSEQVEIEGNCYLMVMIGIECSESFFDTVSANNYKIIPVYVPKAAPPDLRITASHLPPTAVSGQYMPFSYTVRNTGTGRTAATHWSDYYYLSTDPLPSSDDRVLGWMNRKQALEADSAYVQNDSLALPIDIATGNYYVLLVTDARDEVCEFGNESNNWLTQYIFIQQPPPADLVITDVAHPLTARAGEEAEVQWTVANRGSNNAFGRMKEVVYLSRDSRWDVEDLAIGTRTSFLGLQPGQEAAAGLKVRLTGVGTGNYYLLVRTDALDNIHETNDENNTTSGAEPMVITVPALSLGVPVHTTLEHNIPLYYRLDVSPALAGETMLLTLTTPDSIAADNQLYVRQGEAPTLSNFDFRYDKPLYGNQEVIVPALQPDIYYFLALGAKADEKPQNVTLLARILSFEIRSVQVNKGGNNGFVTTELRGAKFSPDMKVFLQGGTVIAADTLYYLNSARAFARFDLRGKPIGRYDVAAQKSNGERVVLKNSFAVETGGPANLFFHVDHPPSSVRLLNLPPVPVYMAVEFKNMRNIDVPIPVVPIRSIGGAPIALVSSQIQNDPPQLSLEVPLRELDVPFAYLRAGATGSVVIYTNNGQPLVFLAELTNYKP